MSVSADLYVTDFIGWTELQARLLRAAAAQPPDPVPAGRKPSTGSAWPRRWRAWAGSYRQALASRVGTVIEHLLQLEIAPAHELRSGWLDTVARARDDMQGWLANEPGLVRRLPDIIAEQLPWSSRLVSELLRAAGEPADGVTARLQAGGYTVEQIIGGWLPPAP